MSTKIVKYIVRPDNFPDNIISMKYKMLLTIDREGMVERSSLAIEGYKISSIRQAVVNFRNDGLINIHNGYIALSEEGLKACTEALNKKIEKIIRATHVLKVFQDNDTIPISSPMICEKLLTEDEDKKSSQITIIIKKLVNDGEIFLCKPDKSSRQRHYYLTKSKVGQEYLKDNEVVNKTPINPLHLVFQRALPGTLTGGSVKPYMC